MITINQPVGSRRGLWAPMATVLAALLALLMLGSPPAGAQSADGPTAEFCAAWADYQDAQDGAELNTALGAMEDALTSDSPAEVAEALVTLGQGDLDPAEVQAASDVVAAWADEACAETTTTTTESTTTTAGPTTTTTTASTTSTTDSDDGTTPSGGVDTGAGGTATDGKPSGLGLVATVALLATGVGALGVVSRRRIAQRE